MAPAVELRSVIPASGRTQENHGGPRRAASALLRRSVLYLQPALQRTAGFETEGGRWSLNTLARHWVIPGSC